jgi:hypothetical protein
MSSSLPTELLDLIVDHLRTEPAVLNACYVVSKSWISPTRKRLFARVVFAVAIIHTKLWKKRFPDPSNSPARYTCSLSIYGLLPVTAIYAGVDGWACAFHHLVRLGLYTPTEIDSIPLPEVFGFVCSFPLLEDLKLVSSNDWNDTDGWDTPSTSPKFTRSVV